MGRRGRRGDEAPGGRRGDDDLLEGVEQRLRVRGEGEGGVVVRGASVQCGASGPGARHGEGVGCLPSCWQAGPEPTRMDTGPYVKLAQRPNRLPARTHTYPLAFRRPSPPCPPCQPVAPHAPAAATGAQEQQQRRPRRPRPRLRLPSSHWNSGGAALPALRQRRQQQAARRLRCPWPGARGRPGRRPAAVLQGTPPALCPAGPAGPWRRPSARGAPCPAQHSTAQRDSRAMTVEHEPDSPR